MIVVMKRGASDRDVERVATLIREMGLSEHVSVGTDRTIIGAVGDRRHLDMTALESIPGVDRLVPILAPYKLASREMKTEPSIIPLGNGVVIGGPEVCMIAGPCSVEHETQLLTTAHAVREAGAVALRGVRPLERGLQAAHQSLRLPGPRRGWPQIAGQGAGGDRSGRGDRGF